MKKLKELLDTPTLKLKTSSMSNFQKSFTVELYKNDIKIGFFKFYLDSDEGGKNQIEVSSEYRNKGFGKILLMCAIRTAEINDIPFVADMDRSDTQFHIYKSLEDKGFIEASDGYILTDDGSDYLQSLNIIGLQ